MQEACKIPILSLKAKKPLFAAFQSIVRQYNATCLDDTRAIIAIQGEQALSFLQGLITNDVRKFDKEGGRLSPLYAVILSSKGKVLNDIFIHPQKDDPTRFLLDLSRNSYLETKQMLERYKLRRKINLDDVSNSHHVWVCRDDHLPTDPFLRDSFLKDPRLPEIGCRAVLASNQHAQILASSFSSPASPVPTAPSAAFAAHRYRLGVAEGDLEIPSGVAAPLEFNLDRLNGISYEKGCYIGQERTSYAHFRGITRRRLAPIRILSEDANVMAGADVTNADGSKVLGTVRGVAGEDAIALVSIKDFSQAAKERGGEGESALKVRAADGNLIQIQAFRPQWWSNEWGSEEGL
uniref:CAF17 C-terminal domain-containing protein n=1 Tax=Polytomella parva TaxID=51329 RepID=A0A7S0V6Q6_9CHLO|mmetsp:Transcript_29042/g.53371  ORF Transcript_29042/g.53371 Transcript_29042/m.53371 type:complete len:350 (+) Transcript_29042:63-1112(+)